MAPEVPQPADEEFESRLSWSPPGSAGAGGVRPSRAPRRRPVRADAPSAGPSPDGDVIAEIRQVVLELRDRLEALEAAVEASEPERLSDAFAVVHRELGTGLRSIREELAAQVTAAAHPGPTGDELAALGDEMAQLRRRIGLRAGGTTSGLSDADVERIAEEVVARLAGLTPPAPPRGRRPR